MRLNPLWPKDNLSNLDWDNLGEWEEDELLTRAANFVADNAAGEEYGMYRIEREENEPGVITIAVPGGVYVFNPVQSDLEAVTALLSELTDMGKRVADINALLFEQDVNTDEAIAARKAAPRPPIQGRPHAYPSAIGFPCLTDGRRREEE